MKKRSGQSTLPRARASQLANLLGLSKSRISRLKSSGILSADAAGLFDVGVNVRSYINFLKSAPNASKSVSAARIAYLAQQEQRLRLANDIKSGEAIPTGSVQDLIFTFVHIVVQGVEAWPGRAAPLVVGKTEGAIREYLHGEVRVLRAALADALEQYARENCGTAPGWKDVKGPL